MKTKKIKKIIKTPSEALQAMVDGLLKQNKRKTFQVDMGSFGNSFYDGNKNICCGCAATCTIQEVANKNLTAASIVCCEERADFLGFDKYDLEYFEGVIEDARCGMMNSLFDYFRLIKKANKDNIDTFPNFHLTSETWKKEIPKVRKYIKYLKENEF